MRPSIIVLVCIFAQGSSLPGANLADFREYSLFDSTGQILLPGRLYVPPETINDPTTPRPMMLYLHGGGARGTNNTSQVEQTPDFMLDEAKRRSAFLYVPQTADTWASTTQVDYVMTMINRAIAEKYADTNRLYATGYSNGGGGVWSLLSRQPNRFAGAIAVAGIVPASGFNPANLLGTAILAAHARDDATVPVARTRTVVDGILAAAGQPLPNYAAAGSNLYFLVSNPQVAFHRDVVESEPPGSTVNYFISRNDLDLMYFEQPTGGHTGLFGVFYSPPVYDWMFDHSLAAPEPGGFTLVVISLLMTALRMRRRGPSAVFPSRF
jgi:predicted peptidase